jgi:cysteine/O-acetylserine efflux protein
MLNWTSFLSYILVTAYTPGPNNIMSMNNAAAHGFRKGIPFNLGIWAAFSVVMALCALFSAALYALVPKIQLPMKLLGASYMLYLAWKTARPGHAEAGRAAIGGFWSGFALQFVNPKIFIYGVTAMSSYILPAYGSPPILLAFALFLAFVGFSANLCWAASGALFLRLFSRHSRAVNAAMAVLLGYCAVSLFL